MRKLLTLLALVACGLVQAQPYNYNANPSPILQDLKALGVPRFDSMNANLVTPQGGVAKLIPGRRTISSGATDTATAADYAVLWNSSSNATKAQAIPACATLTDQLQLVIGDEAQTAGTYSIVVTPAAGTINAQASIPISSNGGFASLICDGPQANWVVTYLTATGAGGVPGGRLSLASQTPVMTTSQTTKTTLYYTSWRSGGKVPYFNGVFDQNDTIPANEVSTAMATSGTGVLNAGGVFDVWWSPANHNICIATNGSGGGWASDTGGSSTARGTGYSQLDSITRSYVTNKNAITHCYNGTADYGALAANAATYLGTIKTDAAAAGTVNWTFGTSAAGGGAAEFGVCNYYNRVEFGTMVQDSTATWTDAVASWHALNTAATGSGLNNRITWVSCNAEYSVAARLHVNVGAGVAATPGAIGIGLNSTSAPVGPVGVNSNNQRILLTVSYDGAPGAGINFVQALAFGNATNATNLYGSTTQSSTPLIESFNWRGSL